MTAQLNQLVEDYISKHNDETKRIFGPEFIESSVVEVQRAAALLDSRNLDVKA